MVDPGHSPYEWLYGLLQHFAFILQTSESYSLWIDLTKLIMVILLQWPVDQKAYSSALSQNKIEIFHAILLLNIY